MITLVFYNLNLLFIVCLFFYSKIKKSVVGNENDRFGGLVAFFSLWLISGLRYMVGTDYGAYQRYFDNLHLYDIRNPFYEKGYYLINYVVGFFTENSQYLFLVTSFIIIYLFHKTISKFSVSYSLSIFLFVTMFYYYETFNITRQYIVVAASFYSMRYIINRDLKKFIIMITIASFFHVTALVMIPFYWVSKMRINKIVYLIILIGTFGLSFFTESIIRFITNFIPSLAYYINYDMVGASANIMTLISISVLLYSLVFIKKMRLISSYSDFFINMVYFGLLFTILARENIMFYRVALYFNVYILLLIPISIKSINKHLRVLAYGGTLFFMTMYHYYLLLNNNGGVLPYEMNIEVFESNKYLILLVLLIAFIATSIIILIKYGNRIKLCISMY